MRSPYKWMLKAKIKGEGLHCQTFEVSGNSYAPHVFFHFSLLLWMFASLNENLQCYPKFSRFSCKILEPLGVELVFWKSFQLWLPIKFVLSNVGLMKIEILILND